LYGRKSLESGRIEQIVYKYRASPTVRSIDFIIPMHHSKSSIPQVDTYRNRALPLVRTIAVLALTNLSAAALLRSLLDDVGDLNRA
jgi:hypothetical protein